MTHLAALVILAALIIAPGLGATLALYRPGQLPVPSSVALVFALGYGIVACISYGLTLAHALYSIPVFVLVSAATLAAWAVAVRRGHVLARVRRLRLRARRSTFQAALGLLAIGAIAALSFATVSNFRARIPYRYWVDGMQNSRLHEIPKLSIQYAGLYSTVSSKVLLDAFGAAVNYIVAEPQFALGPLLWISIVGTAFALWACGRECGLGASAAIVPVLGVANPIFLGGELTHDLGAFRAEALGRLVAFTGLAFGVRALRRGGMTNTSVAAALLALSAGTHLIPTLFTGFLLAGFFVGMMLVHHSREGLVKTFRRGGALVGGALVGYLLIVAAPTRTGLGGATGPSAYGAHSRSFDPTAFLFKGTATGHPASDTWYRTPRRVAATFVAEAFGRSEWKRLGPLVLAAIVFGTLAVALVVLFRVRRGVRYVPLACWTAAFLSVAASLWFVHHYDLFALATFGMRRIYDYAALPVILGVAALIEVVVRPLRSWRPWAPLVAGTAVSAAIVAVTLAAFAGSHGRTDANAIPLLSWVRTNTPCETRIITNTRTVGVFEAMTGRVSLTEGMGPFLRPTMLRQVLPLLMETRRFFRDPTGEQDFLTRNGVDYVVVVGKLPIGFSRVIGKTNEQAFRSATFLQRVQQTSAFTIYRVVDAAPPPNELPTRFPCRTSPLS
jgi:hypothetical protein